MKKVINIKRIGSESGDPGCTNGNYDVEYIVSFSDGTACSVWSCRCGNGCNGSFPINRVSVGQEYSAEEWEELLWGEF